MNSSTLDITHSHAAGTLLQGTSRGDGAAEIAKAHRLRWSRPLGARYVPRSRVKFADQGAIQKLADALTQVGFSVDITIDDARRDPATIEQTIHERQTTRAEALGQRATRLSSKAAAADLRQQQAADRLSPGGEPIKIGHHSEAQHRRAIRRAQRSMSASVELDKAAEEAFRRPAAAGDTGTQRYVPKTVARRLERLNAEYRKTLREIAGYSRTSRATSRPTPQPLAGGANASPKRPTNRPRRSSTGQRSRPSSSPKQPRPRLDPPTSTPAICS